MTGVQTCALPILPISFSVKAAPPDTTAPWIGSMTVEWNVGLAVPFYTLRHNGTGVDQWVNYNFKWGNAYGDVNATENQTSRIEVRTVGYNTSKTMVGYPNTAVIEGYLSDQAGNASDTFTLVAPLSFYQMSINRMASNHTNPVPRILLQRIVQHKHSESQHKPVTKVMPQGLRCGFIRGHVGVDEEYNIKEAMIDYSKVSL